MKEKLKRSLSCFLVLCMLMTLFPLNIFADSFDIKIQKIDNGIVDSNKVLSHIGGTVELTVTPGKGYELESLTVLKGNNTEVKLTKKSENKYTFIMPGIDVYVYSSFKKVSNCIDAHDCDRGPDCPMWGYTDLNPYEWYHDGVHHCIADGIMIGYEDSTFKPNVTITRAMIVTMLWRLENSPKTDYSLTYDDIEFDVWYTEGLCWATFQNIVTGYGNNKFGPNDILTREQMVSVLWRYAKYKGYDVSIGENTNILSYKDVFDVSEYAIPAMEWACGTGIIIGNNGYLMPKDATTRAQTATIFYRYLMNV